MTFVGIGELGIDGPLCVDGFLEKDEMMELMRGGAVGEICGWIFDVDGRLLDNPINERVASAPIPPRDSSTVIGIAKGTRKSRSSCLGSGQV